MTQPPISIKGVDVNLIDLFRVICIAEITILFDSPVWEQVLLRALLLEPFMCHTALAIGAISRRHYASGFRPSSSWSLDDYADIHYAQAIQSLNLRLDNGPCGNGEVAVLASLLFANVEYLRAKEKQPLEQSLVRLHLQGGLRVLHSLRQTMVQPILGPDWDFFDLPLVYLADQLSWFHHYHPS
jgi:hypothetical protein